MVALGGLARAFLESSLVVQIRESQQTDQLNYHSGPDPGLRDGPPPNLHHLQIQDSEMAHPKIYIICR